MKERGWRNVVTSKGWDTLRLAFGAREMVSHCCHVIASEQEHLREGEG
jgi:hypothetical protein